MSIPQLKESVGHTSSSYLLSRYSTEELKEVFRKMLLIRRFEESAEDSYMRGLIHGTMHLSIGQEASAVGMCLPLTDNDYITSTHRGHGHCIAKGADVKRMFAEFFGKESGYCRGRGGSMHIADITKGNLGANGIVGGGLPIAVGAALSIKKRGSNDVAMCFFGDGANNEGAFHESLNFAAIWKLPVVFVCENNKYGMSMSVERSTAVADIAQRAAAYCMPGYSIDGNSVEEVAKVANQVVTQAREGGGPSLVVCNTYRWRGHSKSDRNRYRTREEMDEWAERCPIFQFEKFLREKNVVDESEIVRIREAVEEEISLGIEFAKVSDSPLVTDLTRFVYAEEAK